LAKVLQRVWQAENPGWDPRRFRSLYPLFEAARDAGELERVTLDQAIAAIERRMTTGKLGRYGRHWVARMLDGLGCPVSLEGGIGAPVWMTGVRA
jgi:hypothetical protein